MSYQKVLHENPTRKLKYPKIRKHQRTLKRRVRSKLRKGKRVNKEQNVAAISSTENKDRQTKETLAGQSQGQLAMSLATPTPPAVDQRQKYFQRFQQRSKFQRASLAPSPVRQLFLCACHQCLVVGHRVSEYPLRTCFRCQKQGHYASACPDKPPSNNNLSCQDCNIFSQL